MPREQEEKRTAKMFNRMRGVYILAAVQVNSGMVVMVLPSIQAHSDFFVLSLDQVASFVDIE